MEPGDYQDGPVSRIVEELKQRVVHNKSLKFAGQGRSRLTPCVFVNSFIHSLERA
jgi:hypothetical protein